MIAKTIPGGRLLLALSALSLSLPGCGSGDQPELGQVSGTVTLDGKPLSGVAVVFHPESGRPARGRTDLGGRYELTYIRDTMGTKVGRNRVEIAPNEEGEDEPESPEDVDDPNVKPPVRPGRPVVPARYNTRSELEADVKPGENTFDFPLKS